MFRPVFITYIITCFSIPLFAQSGITFSEQSWDSLLIQAKEENKLIFLDAYTSWCAPCKKMDKEVFPLDTIGQFFNDTFLNIKMNMEEGIGKDLAKKYSIKVYPTFLFIDSSGIAVHRDAGYKTTEMLLELGSLALSPENRLHGLDTRFQSGETDPKFLYDYTLSRYYIADGSHVPVMEAYLKTQENWASEKNLKYIHQFTNNIDVPAFDYIVQNKMAFDSLFGEREMTGFIQNMVYKELSNDGKDPLSLEEIAGIFKKAYPKTHDKLFHSFKMSYYRQAGNREGYGRAAIDYLTKYPSDNYGELNDIAWTFYRVIDDKEMLKKATEYAKASIKIKKVSANIDTLAHLYHKLGKTRKAKKIAKKAIKIAQKSGEKADQSEALLNAIDQEKITKKATKKAQKAAEAASETQE